MKIILNFKNPDEFKRLERQAYNGTLDVSDFPPAEYLYFSELRKIYYAFNFEGLSREEASRKKNILFREYQENVREHEDRLNVYRAYQENIIKSEMLRTAIQKSADIKEIALLACKCISLMTGDEVFYRLQKQKMEDMQ